ncbi:acyl carrier protein, partial [Streptomyces sp. NPDC002133]|uniref:acyl carrier protein n=1 Tax=Streptomyces sp. NPDC002133 TaxID=3154409 RepID=UPI003326664E
TTTQHSSTDLTARLTPLTPAQRHQALTDLIRAQAATVLGHTNSTTIEPNRPFQELGFDSLTALELRNHLTNTTNLKLPATLIYDHPNPDSLATRLVEQLDLDAEPESVAAPVLAGLDKLRSAIQQAAGADETAYEEISARLRELLDDVQAADGRGGRTAGDDGGDLDGASDAELFAFVDDLD